MLRMPITKGMNRRIFLLALLSVVAVHFSVFGATKSKSKAELASLAVDNSAYDTLALSIDGLSAPYVKGNYAIFTAEKGARFVGIAFDFENFRIIHPFKLRTIRDAEYTSID